jgi:hypothetical protein
LLRYLKNKPNAFLKDMQQFIYEAYKILILISSVHHYVKKAGWSRKKEARGLWTSSPSILPPLPCSVVSDSSTATTATTEDVAPIKIGRDMQPNTAAPRPIEPDPSAASMLTTCDIASDGI